MSIATLTPSTLPHPALWESTLDAHLSRTPLDRLTVRDLPRVVRDLLAVVRVGSVSLPSADTMEVARLLVERYVGRANALTVGWVAAQILGEVAMEHCLRAGTIARRLDEDGAAGPVGGLLLVLRGGRS